jgi:hypothetical protein
MSRLIRATLQEVTLLIGGRGEDDGCFRGENMLQRNVERSPVEGSATQSRSCKAQRSI